MPFSARSECTQRPGHPEGYPVRSGLGNAGILGSLWDYDSQQLAPDPYNKRSIRGSRRLNVALPHPDWHRGGAMREDIATVNFAEFPFHALG